VLLTTSGVVRSPKDRIMSKALFLFWSQILPAWKYGTTICAGYDSLRNRGRAARLEELLSRMAAITSGEGGVNRAIWPSREHFREHRG
jgi:hypothetical protein